MADLVPDVCAAEPIAAAASKQSLAGGFQEAGEHSPPWLSSSRTLGSNLQKWGLLPGLQVRTYRHAQHYSRLQTQQLLVDLLGDPAVRASFPVLARGGERVCLHSGVTAVSLEPVQATVVSMDFFDKLLTADPPIVRPNGHLVKRMEEEVGGIQVADELRAMLAGCADSPHGQLFSPQERGELLFRLLEHVCLGGGCCQYEDELSPYLEAAKQLYRQLVVVRKDPDAGEVHVASEVHRLLGWRPALTGDPPLFPAATRHNWCYVLHDPLKRVVTLLYHACEPWW